MTKEQAIEELKKTQSKDTETAHFEADIVLCKFLTGLGYGDVVEEWERGEKWYA